MAAPSVSMLERAQIELEMVGAVLADDALPAGGGAAAILRAWSFLASASSGDDSRGLMSPASVEALCEQLRGRIRDRDVDGVRVGLAALIADPYRPMHRRDLRRHADLLRTCLQSLAPYEPGAELHRSTLRLLSRLRRHRTLLLVAAAIVACGAAAWLRLRPPASWRASYFPNADLEGAPVIGHDRDIRFDWGGRRPRYDFWPTNYSVRWESCLRLAEAGDVVFTLGSDDGSRVIVDGSTVLDAWSDHSFQRASAEKHLAPGVHDVRVEYYQKAGTARIELEMQAKGVGRLERLLVPPREPFDAASPCSAPPGPRASSSP
jgi:hypothetical protein